MSSGRKQFKIYGPAHFRATWERFLEICERDGQSASELIRVWVEGYVARKDPGNPQRPLTAFVDGHQDELASRRSDVLKELLEYAGKGPYREVKYKDIIDQLKARGWPGHTRVDVAYSIEDDLKKFGVRVLH